MIVGQPIEFARTPYQRVVPREKKILDLNEQHVIDTEIDKVLAKGAITPSSHEEGEYLSPIFTRAKKDGSFRLILNLKCLNTHVQYHHFKMDSLNTVLEMVKSSCFMASIDLKDAYYSVPIATVDQKYLKFLWRRKLYKYVCFPNGLAFCPRKLTKLLKPVSSHLRQLGHLSASHIDDSYLQGDDYDDCERNVRDAVKLLKILDVFSIYSLQVSSFMYLYHNDALPIAFNQIFQTGNQIHQYSTRYSTFYRPHNCRTNIKKFSILFQGPTIWNSLPSNIKNAPTFIIFKRVIKPFLRARQDST